MMRSMVKQDMSTNPHPSRICSREAEEKSLSSTFSCSSGKEDFLSIFAKNQIPLPPLVSVSSGKHSEVLCVLLMELWQLSL